MVDRDLEDPATPEDATDDDVATATYMITVKAVSTGRLPLTITWMLNDLVNDDFDAPDDAQAGLRMTVSGPTWHAYSRIMSCC